MIDFTRLDAVKRRRPLIHCLSNLVSANDCANLALAAGASPIMAQAAAEAAEITAAASATVLNTGTPDGERFAVCARWGREAARLGQPLVLDPVGVGASPWRLRETEALLEAFTPSILRVNLGEARALLQDGGRGLGVDSPAPAGRKACLAAARELAARRGTVVLLSGAEDVIADGGAVFLVSGGSALAAQVTGTGCMLSVLCGVFAAVEPDMGRAAVLAAAFWKVCARRAEQAAGGRGPGSFRTALLDAAGTLTAGEFAREAEIGTL